MKSGRYAIYLCRRRKPSKNSVQHDESLSTRHLVTNLKKSWFQTKFIVRYLIALRSWKRKYCVFSIFFRMVSGRNNIKNVHSWQHHRQFYLHIGSSTVSYPIWTYTMHWWNFGGLSYTAECRPISLGFLRSSYTWGSINVPTGTVYRVLYGWLNFVFLFCLLYSKYR